MAFSDLRPVDKGLSIASAILLPVYFVFAVFALASPSDDPQQGMAQGFIILVALVLMLFGGALWFGVARRRPWLVRVVSVLVIFPAVSLIAQEIFLLVHRGR